jgi:hypothetical protein
MFFDSFLSGFESLRGNDKKVSFTPMQMEMLDQLVAGNHFQVSSTDMNCGSGKTTLAVGATLGLLRPGDKLVVVYRPAKTASPLMSQIEALAERFSGGRAHVGTTGIKGTSVHDVVASNDVVITSCMLLECVMKAVVDMHRAAASTPLCARRPKVYLIFDESHQIFPSMPLYVHSDSARCRELFPFLPLSENLREADKYHKWITMNSVKSVGRRLSQRAAQAIQSEDVESVAPPQDISSPEDIRMDIRGLVSGIECLQSFVQQGLSQLLPHQIPRPSHMPSFQCLFLSAGGEFHAGARMISSASVIESLFQRWFSISVAKVISEGANVDSYRYTKVFRIYPSGAEQIGGVSDCGRPKVYEAMLGIAFNWMVKGRLLFIVRRQQVDAFASLLDEHIARAGQYYTYTSDKEYWNAKDTEGKPLFNIILVREDELQDLEGVNIDGIKAVYLFSVGRVQDLLQKMQGIGRVGRVGQGRTYTFIMVDCATRGNAKKENITEDVMMQALGTNSVWKPHVVDVTGMRVLHDKITDIPLYDPPETAPSADQHLRIKDNLRMANKQQVCKFIRCDKSGRHQCINLARGYKCSWYHPKSSDFVKPMMLDGSKFNIRYCQRGVFTASKAVAPARRGILPSTVAPWAAEACVKDCDEEDSSSSKTGEAVNSSLYESFFPKLGETAPAAVASKMATATAAATAAAVIAPKLIVTPPPAQLPSAPRDRAQVTPRAPVRSVCLFAVLGKSKCKYSRTGKQCPFRHPEIKADNVTEQEFKEAVAMAKANISKRTGRPLPGAVSPASQSTPARRPTATASTAAHNPPPSVRKAWSADVAKTSVAKPTAVPVSAVKPPRAAAATPPAVSGQDGGWSTVPTRKSRSGSGSVAGVLSTPTTPHSTSQLLPTANCFAGLIIEEPDFTDEAAPGVVEVEVASPDPAPPAPVPPPPTVKSAAAIAAEAEALRQQEAAALALAVQIEARKMAEVLLACGATGEELLTRVVDLGTKAASVHFVREFVCLLLARDYSPQQVNYSWCNDVNYGPAISFLASLPLLGCGAAALYGVQQFCNFVDFPRCETSAGQRSLLDLYFRLLYTKGMVDAASFLTWADDDVDAYPGKMKAVVQSSELINFIREDDEDEEDGEEDEEKEMHFATAYIATPEKKAPTAESSKHDRQQQKRERRAERVAQREEATPQ